MSDELNTKLASDPDAVVVVAGSVGYDGSGGDIFGVYKTMELARDATSEQIRRFPATDGGFTFIWCRVVRERIA